MLVSENSGLHQKHLRENHSYYYYYYGSLFDSYTARNGSYLFFIFYLKSTPPPARYTHNRRVSTPVTVLRALCRYPCRGTCRGPLATFIFCAVCYVKIIEIARGPNVSKTLAVSFISAESHVFRSNFSRT